MNIPGFRSTLLLATVLALPVCILPAQSPAGYTTAARFCNFSSTRRIDWGIATVPFPQGVWSTGKSFDALSVPAELVPFGARWPDGSVRYAQLTVLLDLQPNQEVLVDVGEITQQLPAFQPSPWVSRGLARFDWRLEVGVPGVGVRTAPFVLARIERDSPVRKAFLFRARVPDTDLVYDLWLDVLTQQDCVPFELKLINSNVTSQEWTQRVDSVDLVVSGALPMVRGALRKGVVPESMTEFGPNRVHLLGPTSIYDGQGQEWWGDLAFWHPTGGNGEWLRTSTVVAEIEHPLLGCAVNWTASGAFGPFGAVPLSPPWILDGGRQAASVARTRFASFLSGRGDPWDDMPQGMLPMPSYTGEQPDFGAAKLVEIVSSGLPDGIEEARYEATEEACRPVHHREPSGEPVTSVSHPDWVSWGGRCHFSSVICPDRLGKPYPEPQVAARGWGGRDNQHWSSLTLATTALLTCSHSLMAELDNEAELYLSSHTLPSMKPNWSTNFLDEPRAVGRVFLSMAWNYLATGREDVKERMRQRAIQCVRPFFAGGKVSGPVKPIGFVGPDPRILPKYDFWKPWEESLAVLGLEACYRITGAQEARDVAAVAAKTLITYGWKITPSEIIVATGVMWKADGQPLTPAEYQDPDKVLWSYNTAFSMWAMPATMLTLEYGQIYHDADMEFRAQVVLQSLQQGRTEPREGGWDRFADWSAVR